MILNAHAKGAVGALFVVHSFRRSAERRNYTSSGFTFMTHMVFAGTT